MLLILLKNGTEFDYLTTDTLQTFKFKCQWSRSQRKVRYHSRAR